MASEVKEVLCEKCGTNMVEEKHFPPRSLDMYSGSTNITHTSVLTSVTVYPLDGTSVNSITGQPHYRDRFVKPAIKIVNYICPSCKWKTQKRE